MRTPHCNRWLQSHSCTCIFQIWICYAEIHIFYRNEAFYCLREGLFYWRCERQYKNLLALWRVSSRNYIFYSGLFEDVLQISWQIYECVYLFVWYYWFLAIFSCRAKIFIWKEKKLTLDPMRGVLFSQFCPGGAATSSLAAKLTCAVKMRYTWYHFLCIFRKISVWSVLHMGQNIQKVVRYVLDMAVSIVMIYSKFY